MLEGVSEILEKFSEDFSEIFRNFEKIPGIFVVKKLTINTSSLLSDLSKHRK
jgi:hypothetical protein